MAQPRSLEERSLAHLAQPDSVFSKALASVSTLDPVVRADLIAMRGYNQTPIVPITQDEKDNAYPDGSGEIPAPRPEELPENAAALKDDDGSILEPAPIDESMVGPEDADGTAEVIRDTSTTTPDADVGMETTGENQSTAATASTTIPDADTSADMVPPAGEEGFVPTRPVTQGIIAESKKPELDVMAKQGDRADYPYMVDHPAFQQLQNTLAQLAPKEVAPSPSGDGLSDAMDVRPPQMERDPNLTLAREAQLNKDVARSKQTLIEAGYDPTAITEMLRLSGEEGLTEVTPPWEVAVTSAATIAVKGGFALAKSVAPTLIYQTPLNVPVMAVADEIMESDPVAGFMFSLFGLSSTTIPAAAIAKLDSQISGAVKRQVGMDKRLFNMFTKDFTVPKSAPEGSVAPFVAGIEATVSRTVAPEVSALPNLGTQVTRVKSAQIALNLAQGNFADTATHKAAMNMLSLAREAPYITSEDASVLKQTQEVLAEVEPIPQPDQPSNPFLDTGGPVTAQGRESLRAPIHKEVSATWYGPQKYTTKAIREKLEKRFDKGDETFSPAGVELAKRLKEGVYGDSFVDDVLTEYELKSNRLTKTGVTYDPVELYDDIVSDMHLRYQEGIAAEVEMKVTQLDHSSMMGTRTDYVKGGIEERNPQFMAPAPEDTVGIMGRPQQAGDTTSRYQFKDWNISSQLVPSEDLNRMIYKPTSRNLPVKAAPVPFDKFTQVQMPYHEFTTLARAKQSASAFTKKWMGKSVLKKGTVKNANGKTPPIVPEAEKLKVRTKMFKTADKRVEGEPDFYYMQALPDQEVDNAARFLGWDDSHIQGTSVMGRDGFRYQYLAEDITTNKALWDEWNILSPKSVAYQEKLIWTEQDMKYRILSAADASYRKQRDVYMKKVLGIPLDPTEARKQKRFYYSELDRVAVMHNLLMNDIRLTAGTDMEDTAKRAYLLTADTISGTNRYDDLITAQRQDVRAQAWKDLVEFRDGDPSPEQMTGTIYEYAQEHGLTFEDAQAIYEDNLFLAQDQDEYQDAISDFMSEDYANMAQEMAAQEAGRASDQAGTSAQNLVPGLKGEYEADIYDPGGNKYLLAKYVEALENTLGTRVVDPTYTPSAPGRPAKFNIMKINDVNDVMGLVSNGLTLDMPKSFIPTKVVGVPPALGVSEAMARSLAVVISDLDQRLVPAANALVSDPSNAVKAMSFEKHRAIQNMLLSAYSEGTVSAGAKRTLENYSLEAFNDQMLLSQASQAIENNYPIYAENDADTRISFSLAEMYSSLPTSQARIAFSQATGKLSADLNYEASKKVTLEQRKKFNELFEKDCA